MWTYLFTSLNLNYFNWDSLNLFLTIKLKVGFNQIDSFVLCSLVVNMFGLRWFSFAIWMYVYWLLIFSIRFIIWTSQFTFESYLIFIVLILLSSSRTNSIVILLLINAFVKRKMLSNPLAHFLVRHIDQHQGHTISKEVIFLRPFIFLKG